MANSRTAAQMKYDNQNARFFRMKLNKKHDAKIIEKLESVDNMQGYIKALILKDIGEAPSRPARGKKTE